VNAFPITPARRLTLALAISLLVHTAMLFLPYVQLPHQKINLPPLTVRLERVHKPEAQIEDKPALSEHEQPMQLSKVHDGTPARSPHLPMAVLKTSDQYAKRQPFPARLSLKFIEYTDGSSLRSGEIRHRFDNHGGRYTLKAERRAAGPSGLFQNDIVVHESTGQIDEHGLHPNTFSEETISAQARKVLKTTFNRRDQKLELSDGTEATLPPGTQDSLSFMYQLSQLSMDTESFPLNVTDGTQLREYQIEIGVKQEITTPMGNLRALHLRQMHSDGETYFELWLGEEYRMLPVKYRILDGSGKILKEFVVSDIRAADE
jgi:hypothetical protein